MPRSVALTGLIIIVSLSTVGFAAFSSGGTVAPTGVDVPGIDASVAAAVFAAPLVPLAEPEPAVAPSVPPRAPLGRSALEPEAAATTTTAAPTTTTTTTAPRAPTTTKPPPTTSPPTTTTTTTTVPPTTVPATTVPPTTAPPPATSWPPAVEQWRALVSDYFPEPRVEEALAIISCESRGDPSATNSSSGAAGLFQFIRSTWDWVAAEAGLDSYSSGAPYDPNANTAAAAWLVQRSIDTNHSGGAWGHWSCRRVLG